MPVIDRHMIDAALRLLARGESVSVNLSAGSIDDAELLHYLRVRLRDNAVPAGRLWVEITETAAIGDLDAARELSERLTAMNVGLALDDFGTGFSTFTYLRELPVDHLKIDRSFVRDLARSEQDQRVVRSIVSIAREFGHETVAEGVEDQASLGLLASLGVDYAQGYHLGRPAPVDP